jgi:hypothetical protein
MIDLTPEELEAKLVDILKRSGAIKHQSVQPLGIANGSVEGEEE